MKKDWITYIKDHRSQELISDFYYLYKKIKNTYNKKSKIQERLVKIMKVKDCMSNQVCYCTCDSTVKDVAKLMCDNHVGCIPVCDQNECVVGLLTDRDIILRTIACDKEYKDTKVSDVMTTSVCCCNEDTEISEATKLMSDLQIRRLPVLKDNKLVGILTIGDLANSQNVDNKQVADTVECICNKQNTKNAE